MALQKLEKVHWRGFCDCMSQGLIGGPAEVEFASLQPGVEPGDRWLPIAGFFYDDDVLEINLAGAAHMSIHLHEMYIDYSTRGLEDFAFSTVTGRGRSCCCVSLSCLAAPSMRPESRAVETKDRRPR
jgi:hypothetical protein